MNMEILILVAAMVAVGLIVGWLAGLIWKDRSSEDARRDYIAATITAVVFGLIDWYVVPAMGFSETLRNIAVATEPAGIALLVLWIIRRARK
jgi:uncharacterized membrane protein YeaQ/YmgE (transglycosylase-associated protein family)